MKIDFKDIIQYLLMYLLIISQGAVIWVIVLGGDENYVTIFVTFALIIGIMIAFNISLNKKYIFYCLSVTVCYFISAFVNGIGLKSGLNIKTAIISYLYILIAVVAYKIDPKNSLKRFIRLMYVISLISVFLYIAQVTLGVFVFPNILFPPMGVRNLHGYLFYTVPHNEPERNFGIFYEPGVYQILLNSAIYILIFYKNEVALSRSLLNRYFMIFLVALLTTKSTTGYISLAIIIVCILFKKKDKNKQKIIAFLAIFCSCILCDYIINGNNSLIGLHLIKKIKAMKITKTSYSVGSSGGARLFVIQQAITSLRENPLFGTGGKRLRDLIDKTWWEGFGTGNVLFTLIGTKGLVTAVISTLPLFSIAKKNSKEFTAFICYILIYLNTTIAQSHIWYSVFVLIALYNPHKKVKNENIKVAGV